MAWVRTARVAKPKSPLYPGHVQPLRVVIELIEVDDPPPGSGHATRHAAKQHSKRKPNARPLWADDT